METQKRVLKAELLPSESLSATKGVIREAVSPATGLQQNPKQKRPNYKLRLL